MTGSLSQLCSLADTSIICTLGHPSLGSTPNGAACVRALTCDVTICALYYMHFKKIEMKRHGCRFGML